MLTLGLDIGGTSIKASLLDNDKERWSRRSAPYARPDRDRLFDALQKLFGRSAGDLGGVEAVGLCAPGLLAPDGKSIAVSINVPGLVGLGFDELLAASGIMHITRASGLHIITDALAGALDIHRTRSLAGRLLAISMGTGVGASVLDHGTPLIVTGSGPGHLGHIDVTVPETSDNAAEPAPIPLGADGAQGTLEAYIGLPALKARLGEKVEEALTTLSVDAVPCQALVRALRISHAMYRPNHIVLLGGVGIRLARLIPELHARTALHLTSLARDGWTLSAGDSDFHAARGAAWHAGAIR